MIDLSTLLAFCAAFLVFAASPGPDKMTIVARTISHGAASGIVYGAGTVLGILLFLTLAAFGLSVVAQEASFLLTALRYGGAVYLIWMGLKLWTAEPVVAAVQPTDRGQNLINVFFTGFALNLGNPKMPLFYIALLPNVVGADLTPHHLVVLAAAVVLVEVLVIGAHVMAAGRARRFLKTPRIVRRVNRAAGGVMVGAGVAVMVTR